MSARGLLACLFLLSVGCAEDGPMADLPELHDLPSAPAVIRQAARAVVRIGSATAFGTGSFISDSGRLMTNNHVLGNDVCPTEGCWVKLTFAHQRGEPWQAPRILFALPEHVDVGLDLAILQMYESPPGEQDLKLSTPDFLRFAPSEASALVGRHVTIVGHPRGKLKKWSEGVVVDASGVWFECTNFILPGDSGSPVLDDDGQIVGLIHRASSSADDVTKNGVNLYSVGTASVQLQQAMDAPLPAVMVSTLASTSARAAVAHNLTYLNGRRTSALIDGKQTSVLSLLGEACDEGLSREDFSSLEELQALLAPCVDAQSWIECRADAEEAAEGVVCPEDKSVWLSRYRAMNDKKRGFNGQLDLNASSFAVAALSPDEQSGTIAGAASLTRALDEAEPLRTFSLAPYMAAFSVELASTRALIEGYKRVPHYELYALDISYALLWLGSSRALPGQTVGAMLKRLEADPGVSLSTRLYIEDVRYNSGAL